MPSLDSCWFSECVLCRNFPYPESLQSMLVSHQIDISTFLCIKKKKTLVMYANTKQICEGQEEVSIIVEYLTFDFQSSRFTVCFISHK